jgi:class 3 adenylate cyclase/tetratricopeptide (TPR) repeat protein
MRALAAGGRRADALKHYKDLVALLKRELTTEPDEATKSLIIELGRTQPQIILPAISDVAQPKPPRPPPIREPQEKFSEEPTAQCDAALPTAARHSPYPERRQLSIVVVSLMPFSARLDPEDMRDLIGAFRKEVASVVARFDGFVAQYVSDGVHIYFGYPIAHEDDAERAVRAGLAIREAVGSLPAPWGVPLQARAGIATGAVVISGEIETGDTRQYIAVGEASIMAAKLQAVAAPGTIVIDATTQRIIGGIFEYRALHPNGLVGPPEPMQVWQVRAERTGVSRFEARCAGPLSPLLGRQEEIDLILRHWQDAKLGEGRVVQLSGEPGIGKSRIVESLLERLEGEPHIRQRYFCLPHHTSSPLYPFIAQLEHAAGLAPGSSVEAKLDKLEALLKPTARNLPQDLALIADLLSLPTDGRYPALTMSRQQKREMTLNAILDQLKGVAAQRPVLIIFEDIHWIDPTSLDLLDRTVARVANLPVLLIVTSRPEFQVQWIGHPHVTMLPLSRLGRRDSASIVGGVAKGKALPEVVLEQVLEHADGVPLFIEELTKTVLESELLRETETHYELTASLLPPTIPATLHASLLARLDRLVSVKEVAQIAAIIGREFSYALIAAVSSLPDRDLRGALARLVKAELMFERGVAPDAIYQFKHALVQDAAYASLVRSRRRQLHDRVANILEASFPTLAEAEPQTVAHHLWESQQFDRAIAYWLKASYKALDRYANAEAITYATRALSALVAIPTGIQRSRTELALLAVLGPALIATIGHAADRTLKVYERGWELARADAQSVHWDTILLGLGSAYWTRAEYPAAIDVATEFVVEADRRSEAGPICVANRLACAAHCAVGAFTVGEPYGKRAFSHFDAEHHSTLAPHYGTDVGIGAACQWGLGAWHIGQLDKAEELWRFAIARAKQLAHHNSTAYALYYAGAFAAFIKRDFDGVAALGAELTAHAIRNRLPHWHHHGLALEGIALAQKGKPAEGIALASEGLELCERSGHRAIRPVFLAGLADAYLVQRHFTEAKQAIEAALLTAEQTTGRWMNAELWRLQGALALASAGSSGVEEALHSYRRGLEISRQQGSVSFALRLAVSLARLLSDRGLVDESHNVLTSSLELFPPSTGSSQLAEARSLAEHLGATIR